MEERPYFDLLKTHFDRDVEPGVLSNRKITGVHIDADKIEFRSDIGNFTDYPIHSYDHTVDFGIDRSGQVTGKLKVDAPTEDTHVVNKQYVDTSFAPAGFGLGGSGKWINANESLSSYIDNGFYSWSAGASDAPFSAGSMIVVKRSDKYVYQIAFRDDVTTAKISVRKLTENTWSEWKDWKPDENKFNTFDNSYSSSSDSTEDNLNAWLDSKLSSIGEGHMIPVRIACYPAVSGNVFHGLLVKHDSDNNYANCLMWSFNGYIYFKRKLGGKWSNTQKSFSISQGGTGATTAADARSNLGITPTNIGAILQSANYYSSGKSADDLGASDSLALIPCNATTNPELFAIIKSGFAYVLTVYYANINQRAQIAISYAANPPKMAFRTLYGGVWTSWTELSSGMLSGLDTGSVSIASGTTKEYSDSQSKFFNVTVQIGSSAYRHTFVVDRSAVNNATNKQIGYYSDAMGNQMNLVVRVSGTTVTFKPNGCSIVHISGYY